MKIGYKNLKILAVIYAIIPIIIFYAGWLNIASAIIFIALLAAAFFFFIKNSSHRDGKAKSITLSKKQIIIISLIAFAWCFIAGQGGFVHQSQDHVVRNALFKDIISQKWPVTYDNGNTMMCYYIAHWMVPALFGKITLFISGSTRAAYIVGNIALLLWSSLGCSIVLLLVAMITNTGKKPMVFFAILLFIFFSGMDIIGVIIAKRTSLLYNDVHLETWNRIGLQYSSNMTCLFWVFNQTIVPWMIVLCILNEVKLKNLALLAIISFPYGPLPFFGVVILCVLKAVSSLCEAIKAKKIASFFKDAFSLQNILAMIAVAPVYLLYYTSSAIVANGIISGAGSTGAANTNGSIGGLRIYRHLSQPLASKDYAGIRKYIWWHVLLLLLEIGGYAVIILRRVKPNIILIGTLIFLSILPMIQFGKDADLCMRASIPGLVYICITFIQVVIKEMPEWGEYGSFTNCMRHKKLLIAALIIFFIGAFTPGTEIKREMVATVTNPYSDVMHHFDESDSAKGHNFVANNFKKSNFYKYLCKKTDDDK